MTAARGVEVSYETIRAWCTRFGPEFARWLRQSAPRPGDKWHLDEVFIKVGGVRKYLWRAVDQDYAPSVQLNGFWPRSVVSPRTSAYPATI
ncbi:DDE-type integrase/transposase/recombinase [Rhodococcus sp. ARC_M6]|uniref:DDE-type integrase/transposase/recombinase n=1 Tax=Rhodococcus sp. ARC_M6 TaxID=2928852 RepID=UPI0027E09AAA|nr:DDE-type integrase/transposase/recombinase [Rhodococcus sp. ARC_M6]